MRFLKINSLNSSIFINNRSKCVYQLNEHINSLCLIRYRSKFHIVNIIDIKIELFIFKNSVLGFTLDFKSHLAKLAMKITLVLVKYFDTFNIVLGEMTWQYTDLSALFPNHSNFLKFLDTLIV